MNERIKELVKKAGGHISMRNLASNPVQHIESVELWDDRIEKFVELIVKECINQIPKDMHFYDRNRTIDNINRYFGVEE